MKFQKFNRSIPSSKCPREFFNSPILLNHIGSLLRDHDRRRVRISRDDRGHDGRVDHSQSLDTVHPQPRVDHRHFVTSRPHFTRAARMVNGHRVISGVATPIIDRWILERGTFGKFVGIRSGLQSFHRRRFAHFVDELCPLRLRLH